MWGISTAKEEESAPFESRRAKVVDKGQFVITERNRAYEAYDKDLEDSVLLRWTEKRQRIPVAWEAVSYPVADNPDRPLLMRDFRTFATANTPDVVLTNGSMSGLGKNL